MPNQETALAWPFGNGPVSVGTQGLFRLCLKTFVAPVFVFPGPTDRLWVSEDDGDVHFQALFSRANQLGIAHLNTKSMASSFGELQTTLAEYLIIDRPDYHQNLDEK